MPRFKVVNNIEVPLTATEKAQRDAEEDAWAADAVNRARKGLYPKAEDEYIRRGIILMGINLRGANPESALTAAAMKEVYHGGPNANPIATLHDKLTALKDAIEVSATPENIDVTDDSHWT